MQATDVDSCDVAALLAAARKAGLHYRLMPGRADELLVWGATGPEADAICDAMRRRRDEIATALATAQPPLPLIASGDEPDVRVADLPWSVLAAMIDARVLGALDTERAVEEWERQIAGRDDAPTRSAGRVVRL